MRLILMALFLVLVATASHAQQRESYYSDRVCTEEYNGVKQTLPSGIRPDCQTPFAVIEFDWATRQKSYECIGQALVYAAETGLYPVCVLLARNEEELAFAQSQNYQPFGITLKIIETKDWDTQ